MKPGARPTLYGTNLPSDSCDETRNRSKLESRPDPAADGRAWCEECGVLQRVLAIDRGKRPRQEVSVFVETKRTELRRGVVVPIEQVADLAHHLEPARQRVPSADVDDGITRCRARP